jgi:leucyl aminopeptidase
VQIDVAGGDALGRAADALVVPVAKGSDGLVWSDAGREADRRLAGALSRLAEDARFTGRRGRTLLVPTLGQLPARRVILAGLGPSDEIDTEAVTEAVGAAVRAASDAGAEAVVATLPDPVWGVAPLAALEAAATGAGLTAYRFDEYRGAASPEASRAPGVASLTVIVPEPDAADVDRALRRATAIARGVNLARDLTNEPASTLTPEVFAERAQAVAAEQGLSIDVLGPAELAALGAAPTLAVGGGSANPPRMIRLRYQPSAEPTDSRVPGLVGKAITFDTGGYSIKPYEGMLTMKGDMAGGAAVLGTMSALRALDCPVAVEGTICAAENMISGAAFRPGDVIKAMNGVTIEILSTDAEGRLVLADGLVDTARRGATELIDLATLTGAAVVALGDGTTALFASDDALAAQILDASAASGERMWRMPLIDALEQKIEGDVADIKNVGGRAGGAITAALFLQHFTEDLPWVHLDIAGASEQDKATAIGPKGATGVGVRTLLRYLTGPSSIAG